MEVPSIVWILTIAGIVALLAFDFFFHVRKAHTPSLKESATWSAIYVGMALVFGLGVWLFGGSKMGTEYFAGYVTEKALSVDNLFVFGLILLVTAGNLLKPDNHDDDSETLVVRLAKKFLPASEHFDGDKLFTEVDG